MWVCDGCKMLVTLEVAAPDIHDAGIYFTCPVCQHRNELRALPQSNPDDALLLDLVHHRRPGYSEHQDSAKPKK